MNSYDTHTHTQNLDTNLTEEERETKIKHHRTRFIIYGALWFFSGAIALFSTALGAWVGSFFGPEGIIWGAFSFLVLGVILSITFFILGIYHLIKWLNS